MRVVILLGYLIFSSVAYVAAQDDESSAAEPFKKSDQSIEDADEAESTHTLVSPEQLESTRSYQAKPLARTDFDEQKWRKIVGDVDFNEVRKEEKKEPLTSKPLSIPWAGPLLRMISYAVVTGVVILLIYFIIRNISLDLHIKRAKVEDNLEKPVENIEELDIQTLLERATKAGDFKLAIRLYYLRLLKKLHEQKMIVWKKDKTNRDYLSELFSRDFFFDEISRLTLSYESVWYGDHMLRSESFHKLTDRFEILHEKIATGEKQ